MSYPYNTKIAGNSLKPKYSINVTLSGANDKYPMNRGTSLPITSTGYLYFNTTTGEINSNDSNSLLNNLFTTPGQLITYNGTTTITINPGTNGQVLTMNNEGMPEWGSGGGSYLPYPNTTVLRGDYGQSLHTALGLYQLGIFENLGDVSTSFNTNSKWILTLDGDNNLNLRFFNGSESQYTLSTEWEFG